MFSVVIVDDQSCCFAVDDDVEDEDVLNRGVVGGTEVPKGGKTGKKGNRKGEVGEIRDLYCQES